VLGIERKSNANLVVGKAVHSAIETHGLRLLRGEEWTTNEVINCYHKSFKSCEEEDSPMYKDDAQREKVLALGEGVVRAYLDSEFAKKVKPSGVEVRLESDDLGLSLPLLGIIDLVDDEGGIVDIKTIAKTPSSSDLDSHRLQMTAYSLLLADAGIMPTSQSIVFLVKLKNPKVIVHKIDPIAEYDKSRLRRLIDIYVDGVENERYYPSVGMHCAWCSAKTLCKKWGGTGGLE
jgi:hypothetical protein